MSFFCLLPELFSKVVNELTEPAKVKELAALMERYITEGRSTPGPKQKNDVEITWDKRGK